MHVGMPSALICYQLSGELEQAGLLKLDEDIAGFRPKLERCCIRDGRTSSDRSAARAELKTEVTADLVGKVRTPESACRVAFAIPPKHALSSWQSAREVRMEHSTK